MTARNPYEIPELPPAELLAELDAAARVLEELTERAAELTLGMDAQARSLGVELIEDGDVRRLTPSELLDLLGGG
jgi:hypothetical protein